MGPSIDQARIALASRSRVVACQAAFKSLTVDQWLAVPHPATGGQVLGATGAPIKTLSAARAVFSDVHLLSLISALGPNHCIDGWGFLARASSALVARDSHAARHFAYYAQLRGALSILAASGIGLFNGLNVFVDQAGTIQKLENSKETTSGAGTHGVVWPALDAWARIDVNAERFLSTITVHSIPILDCIRSIWPSRQASSIVAPLLTSWSLDLTLGTSHHTQRNISSYAPHQLNVVDGVFEDDLLFLAEMWDFLEPSSAAGFDKLDAHLLRQILLLLHEADNAPLTEAAKISVSESPIAKRYEELSPIVRQSVPLSFLLADSIGEARLFDLARADGSRPTSMLSRALLLLRAAIGFTRSNFLDAGLSADGTDLRPWLDPVAVGRGFAMSVSPPRLMADLWDEVGFAIDDFRAVVGENSVEPREFYVSEANGLPTVTQFERAGLWGLCP